MTVMAPERTRIRLRWYREILLIAAFYVVYSMVRNQFGSAAVSASTAFGNALDIISIERNIGLYVEPDMQRWVIDWRLFLRFWNVFYGTAHFVVTGGVMIYLFRQHPERYLRWRRALGGTTGLAVGSFTAACTPLQRAANVEDHTTWHQQDIANFAPDREPKNNTALRAWLADNAADTLEWLREMGVESPGPRALAPRDRSRFLSKLDQLLGEALKEPQV